METAAKEIKNKSNWYVVRAASNKERSVAERLKKESEVGDLIGKLSRVIVPIENSFYLKNGKKIKREKVRFPGYIFVETSAIGELKFFLKGMTGATGFLTSRSGDIIPLSKSEVDRMIGEFETAKETIETEVKYLVDEEIKILDGPFNTFTGKIVSVNDQKVKVAVPVFGRITTIELALIQIDKKN